MPGVLHAYLCLQHIAGVYYFDSLLADKLGSGEACMDALEGTKPRCRDTAAVCSNLFLASHLDLCKVSLTKAIDRWMAKAGTSSLQNSLAYDLPYQ